MIVKEESWWMRRKSNKKFCNSKKKLLGLAASRLPMVNTPIIIDGTRLSVAARNFLNAEITNDEIDNALKGIGDGKAPGLDGYNAVFFKRSWNIVKHDVCSAVKEFFRTGVMLKQVNCTSITLVPKVTNALKVKDFRPIACCTWIY